MNTRIELIDYIESQKKYLGASSITLHAETNSNPYSLIDYISKEQDITMVIKADNTHVIAVYNKHCNLWFKFEHSKTHNNSKNFNLIGELDDCFMFQFGTFNSKVYIHP